MRFVCWETKVTDTHSEYILLITFTMQQLLGERASHASLFGYMYLNIFKVKRIALEYR